MKELISVGLVVTGFLAIIKVVGIVVMLVGGHPHTNLFLIKQVIFTISIASIFLWLRDKQIQNRQKQFDSVRAKRRLKKEEQEGIWPPPPAA